MRFLFNRFPLLPSVRRLIYMIMEGNAAKWETGLRRHFAVIRPCRAPEGKLLTPPGVQVGQVLLSGDTTIAWDMRESCDTCNLGSPHQAFQSLVGLLLDLLAGRRAVTDQVTFLLPQLPLSESEWH